MATSCTCLDELSSTEGYEILFEKACQAPPVNYSSHVIEVRQTPEFQQWLAELPDQRAQERVNKRIVRLEGGLFGDAKFFQGVGELRIDYGPGYRLYFVRRGDCGGDKSSQKNDIKRAVLMAQKV